MAVQFNLGAPLARESHLWLPLRWGSFNFFSWQLVWVAGLAFGETALHRPLLAGKSRIVVGAISAPIVLAGLLARHGFLTFNPDWFLWMDKWTLGPLRLLNFAAWVGLLLAWNPQVPSLPLKPFALLGRHSLAVFSFHLPLVVAAATLVQSVPLSDAMQIAVGLSVIALLFPWAAWLERKPQLAPATVKSLLPAHRLPIRTRIRAVELIPEIPVRPVFSRMKSFIRPVA